MECHSLSPCMANKCPSSCPARCPDSRSVLVSISILRRFNMGTPRRIATMVYVTTIASDSTGINWTSVDCFWANWVSFKWLIDQSLRTWWHAIRIYTDLCLLKLYITFFKPILCNTDSKNVDHQITGIFSMTGTYSAPKFDTFKGVYRPAGLQYIAISMYIFHRVWLYIHL